EGSPAVLTLERFNDVTFLTLSRGTPLAAHSLITGFYAQPVKLRLDDLFVAIGAKAVAEFGVGVQGEIALDLLPVLLVVVDFFAVGADRQDAAQLFDLGK